MRIGIMLGAGGSAQSIEDLVAIARSVESAGLDNVWMANIRSHDAILTLSIIARETRRIGVGSAVTPTYPRHPVAMAQQALSAAGACRGRFVLGIGLSHKVVIENMYGLSYARPARHMREYLEILMPLLAGEVVNHDGDEYRVHDIAIDVPGATPPKVVIAALGPVMLDLAGRLTDGTNTWMVGPRTMETHIVQRITASAANAGRPAPLVVGGFPLVVTNKPEAVKAALAEPLAIYGRLPSYRAMLEREGAATPADLALVGDESALRTELARLRDIGVTDFNAALFDAEPGAFERSLAFLAANR